MANPWVKEEWKTETLIEPGWKTTFDTLYQSQDPFIREPQRRRLAFVPSVEAAVASLPNA